MCVCRGGGGGGGEREGESVCLCLLQCPLTTKPLIVAVVLANSCFC